MAAAKARAVSEEWRTLHSKEEAAHIRAVAALDAAVVERDAAVAQASVLREQAAQWHARNTTLTSSKAFVELEAVRSALTAREQQLAGVTSRLERKTKMHVTQSQARQRRESAIAATARDRLELLMTERETDIAANTRLKAELESMRAELGAQLTASPPGALSAARKRIERQETALAQMDTRCNALRREAESWKERARRAIASERLCLLHHGEAIAPSCHPL